MTLNPEKTISILQSFIWDYSPREKEGIVNPHFEYMGNQPDAKEIGEKLKKEDVSIEDLVTWLSDVKKIFVFSDSTQATVLRLILINNLEDALYYPPKRIMSNMQKITQQLKARKSRNRKRSIANRI